MANVLEIHKNEITQDYYKIIFQMMVNVSLRGICGIYIFWIKDKLKMPSQTEPMINKLMPYTLMKTSQKIYIVQGKYYLGESVDATPVREVISAWSQFSNLAQLQENANSKLKTKISEIATALEDDSYCV